MEKQRSVLRAKMDKKRMMEYQTVNLISFGSGKKKLYTKKQREKGMALRKKCLLFGKEYVNRN